MPRDTGHTGTRSPARASANGRRRRSDGERCRSTILDASTRLATVEGLEGLSIGGLAAAIGMSKSGVYAHFGSKEELQLATVETAGQIFEREVMAPAVAKQPGIERLLALADAFLLHVERLVFPGGCFFASAAAEMDSRPGPVRDAIVAFVDSWGALLSREAHAAIEQGELDSETDADQVAFEVNAMLVTANSMFILRGDPLVLERARRGVRARLDAAHV
jgi:AcrR family transcriptional regulator